ncbi:tyrosine-protein kinase family protein [Alginatibacterium sediminis]|uniref:Tyrosine-protein kinase family protein n=1 Tax=Alginatibacterium sediminis TaxID=2164068 RepID=A0A420EDN4_9ALTE|nr:tyrosine-protein kinase family protein [Alginatibacterium sediminis]RKF18778.1 tyrosine-protein kinase family protein [Alginatibacterium sediminis]
MSLLPYNYQELERVYQQISPLSSSCISVTSATAGEGVSTLIDAIAQRTKNAGKRVLVVDLNLHHPRSNIAPETQICWTRALDSQNLQTQARIDYLCAPIDFDLRQQLRDAQLLQQWFLSWKQHYHLVLLDTSALNRYNSGNISAQSVCRVSDSVLLCVLAGKTSSIQLLNAKRELESVDANVMGVVLNDRFNPSFKSLVLRSAKRLNKISPKLFRWCEQHIQNSQLLSMRV